MSKHDFRVRYIFDVTPRQLTLALALAVVAGCGAAAMAAVPGVVEAAEAAKVVGGLTAQELLALIAVASLALTYYCIRTMVQQHTRATIALTQIADQMRTMRCINPPDKV